MRFPVRNQHSGLSVSARLKEKVIAGEGGCWLWIGSKNRLGYGQITVHGKLTKAHRASWECFNGKIPSGLMVLHKCDVRNCINPSHLFLGTQSDNMRDAATKKRLKHVPLIGAKNPMAKLSSLQVENMKEERKKNGTSYAKIADKFSVSAMTAYRAINGQSWRQ